MMTASSMLNPDCRGIAERHKLLTIRHRRSDNTFLLRSMLIQRWVIRRQCSRGPYHSYRRDRTDVVVFMNSPDAQSTS